MARMLVSMSLPPEILRALDELSLIFTDGNRSQYLTQLIRRECEKEGVKIGNESA